MRAEALAQEAVKGMGGAAAVAEAAARVARAALEADDTRRTLDTCTVSSSSLARWNTTACTPRDRGLREIRSNKRAAGVVATARVEVVEGEAAAVAAVVAAAVTVVAAAAVVAAAMATAVAHWRASVRAGPGTLRLDSAVRAPHDKGRQIGKSPRQ